MGRYPSEAESVGMRRTEVMLHRLAFALAVGCLAIAHGSSELEDPYDLGDSNDYGAGLKEKEMELQAVQEDPSMSQYNINAGDQEDRIGGLVDGFDDSEDEAPHSSQHRQKSSEGDSM